MTTPPRPATPESPCRMRRLMAGLALHGIDLAAANFCRQSGSVLFACRFSRPTVGPDPNAKSLRSGRRRPGEVVRRDPEPPRPAPAGVCHGLRLATPDKPVRSAPPDVRGVPHRPIEG